MSSQLEQQLNRDNRENQYVRLTDGEWVKTSSAYAAHQAMYRGIEAERRAQENEQIQTRASQLNDDAPHVHSIGEAVQQAKTYERLLFESQFEDVRFEPTADDVLDGGIKEGARLTIRIVPEEQSSANTWHQLARTWLNQTKGGRPTNVTFDKFSVQSVNEPDQERYQISQTFGGDFLYAFGRQPRTMMLTGQVLNGKVNARFRTDDDTYATRSMDWKNALQRRYDRYFRATRCLRNKQKIMIYTQDTLYEGYLLNMQTFTQAETQAASQVTLSFIIKNREFLRQNDDAIPGFLNEEGRIVGDKTLPKQFLDDARKETYLKENLLPILNSTLAQSEKKRDQLLQELANITESTVDTLRNALPVKRNVTRNNILDGEIAIHPFLERTQSFKQGIEEINNTQTSLEQAYRDFGAGFVADKSADDFLLTRYVSTGKLEDARETFSGESLEELDTYASERVETLQPYSESFSANKRRQLKRTVIIINTALNKPYKTQKGDIVLTDDAAPELPAFTFSNFKNFVQKTYDNISSRYSTYQQTRSSLIDRIEEANALTYSLAEADYEAEQDAKYKRALTGS